MSAPIVSVARLGKRYRITHRHDSARYVALRDVVAAAIRRPFVRHEGGGPPAVEDFWALRDVTFDVPEGQVVGIIGPNGAGKSTLLKVMSRITEPSEGRVTLRGRVASLLEVGTGFHPELTGRENIFLNGAILGMTRAEITRKFDEIVAFAEVEQFLDTPVKRYSSGMYVRLAFAVAAHLEPEILIVDEVLAVGDAQFQKKSLGKMREASQVGRTVLFVSHNLAAVASLTTRCLVLRRGQVVFDGPSADAIEYYTHLAAPAPQKTIQGRGRCTAITGVRLLGPDGHPVAHYSAGTPLGLELNFDTDGLPGLSIEAFLVDPMRQRVALASTHQFHGVTLPTRPGRYRTVLHLSPLWLASGTYAFDVTTSVVNSNWDHYVENALEFDVIPVNPGGQSWDFKFNLGYGTFALPVTTPPSFELVEGHA